MWKQIPDFPKYECSENGDIRNIETKKYLTKGCDKKGYIRHCVSKNGKRYIIFPHRITAQLFVENLSNKQCVNHLDGNKTNNNYKNLEWCTTQENTAHAINVLKRKFGGQNKKTVKCIETNRIFSSTSEIEKEMGIDNAWISLVCNGKKKSAKGYHFVYI